MGPAFIQFGQDGTGRFRFIAVEGWIAGTARASVEFTWEGQDDCDPASGRGWAALERDGTLSGHIFTLTPPTRPSARSVPSAAAGDVRLAAIEW